MLKNGFLKPDDFYNEMAPFYDDFIKETRLLNCSLEAEKTFLGSVLGDAERILDLGCGTGRSLKLLDDGKRELFGIDLSLKMVERARAEGLNVQKASTFHLPFSDGTFCAVYSMHMGFGYCRTTGQMKRMADELHRALKAGGRILLDSPHAPKKGRRFVSSWPAGGKTVKMICYGKTEAEIRAVLEKSGFIVMRFFGYYSTEIALNGQSSRIIVLAQKQTSV